jgi:radical SAM superfamily enzyme YgiQ (UPF0313 family)
MSKTIQYFAFSGKSTTCYGIHLVSESLKKYGWHVEPFRPFDKCDVMVSLYWPEQLIDFIKWRYSAGMKGRRVIVGGNYATTSPSAVLPFCDAIFLGDGERWDGQWSGENVIIKGEKSKKIRIEQNIIPSVFSDVQDNTRDFVEISRGCRNKCLFCQYGWLKPYREANIIDCTEVMKRCKTRTIRVFAADRFQHSEYPKIRAWLDKAGKTDSGSDMSISFLLKNPQWLKFTNKVRVGVEGCSYFLRKLVSKPFSDDDLVRFCRIVVDAGIKCFDWYMIYGLPGEKESDAYEFLELVRKVDAALPEKYAICLHWNAFTPNAMTPFQWGEAATTQHDVLIKSLAKPFIGQKATWMHKPLLTNRWTVVKRMLCIRSSEETKQLLFSFATKESKWKSAGIGVEKEFQRLTGRSLCGAWPEEKPFPWDGLVEYNRIKMENLWRVSNRKIKERCNLNEPPQET